MKTSNTCEYNNIRIFIRFHKNYCLRKESFVKTAICETGFGKKTFTKMTICEESYS